jgi:phosphate transport system substrate-binding protein
MGELRLHVYFCEFHRGEMTFMQKQRFLSVLSLLVIVALFAGLRSNITSAAQATPAATEGAAAPIAGAGKITGGDDKEAKALTGAGSSFINPLFSKWVAEYGTLTGVKINYQPIGSGGGIQGVQQQTLDFGATDGAMTDDQIKAAKGGNVIHVAATIGAVAVGYNVPEATEPIKFTPETLALIYLADRAAAFNGADGKPLTPLLQWSDPRLVADNPPLKGVDKNIFVVHRSDSSGTTNIFTSYLSAANPDTWGKKESAAGKGDGGPGLGNAVQWPTGMGGKGSAGVAGFVKQAPYSIGYFELAYATQNNIQTAVIKNKAGNFVAPSADSASAAAANAKLTADLRVKFVNADGDKAYPIAGFTWLLIYEKQTDPAKALALVRLAWWATHDGQADGPALQYAPLPEAVVKADEANIAKITVNGKSVLPADFMK